ncbi:IS3 family transposase [Corallococcus llansteffanensis]|uniref:IS3 family transposase n=1 Tax=Corallococcus llansteffanensis TaxID=2316731 RepID=A0A3A8Q9S7_9BACT|nr:IS3 family transposase [Corallococcus llansteffanensis]RKH63770.1 IS3 family transposase [Corallococcus llansteffanensis]
MSARLSPSSGKPYGLVLVTATWRVPRATVYRHRARRQAEAPAMARRGPKTALTDEALLEAIRGVLAGSPFLGEGHRKVWARLRARDARTSKARCLRLMREAGLLAPGRARRVMEARHHDGTITTEAPDVMWGTNATCTQTTLQVEATVFISVDQGTSECVGIHAAKVGNRFGALDPIRQGIKARFGAYRHGVATGLSIRHDNGSQYTSDVFQDELRFLGAESSPSFVRSPEGNGCAERFIRTRKEQLLWVRTFATVEGLRRALLEWAPQYNEHWLPERHHFLSPSQARRELMQKQAA